ncbi:hypothetical protein FF1_045102 [Malus domestica]
MASPYCYSLSLPSIPKPPNLNKIQLLPTNLHTPNLFSRYISTIRSRGIRASNSSSSQFNMKLESPARNHEHRRYSLLG